MKVLKMLRLVATAIMIGISCIFPTPVKNELPKYQIELRETKDDDIED